MRNFLILVLLLSFNFSAKATVNDSKNISYLEQKGDEIFKYLDYDNYFTVETERDRNNKMASQFINTYVSTFYSYMYALKALSSTEVHRKLVIEKSMIAKGAEPAALSRKQIENFMYNVEESGLKGSQRVSLVIEHRTKTMGNIDKMITRKNVSTALYDAKMTNKNKAQTLILKGLTKEELRGVLTKISDNRIRVYSAGIGKAKLSGIKLIGSGVAIYLTLDLVDTMLYGH